MLELPERRINLAPVLDFQMLELRVLEPQTLLAQGQVRQTHRMWS